MRPSDEMLGLRSASEALLTAGPRLIGAPHEPSAAFRLAIHKSLTPPALGRYPLKKSVMPSADTSGAPAVNETLMSGPRLVGIPHASSVVARQATQISAPP